MSDVALAVIGGTLQIVGVLLATLQVRLIRRNFKILFDPDKEFTAGELMFVKDALKSLAMEGWTLGLVSVGLIVIGIVVVTIGAA